jgi:hypothetical protein
MPANTPVSAAVSANRAMAEKYELSLDRRQDSILLIRKRFSFNESFFPIFP